MSVAAGRAISVLGLWGVVVALWWWLVVAEQAAGLARARERTRTLGVALDLARRARALQEELVPAAEAATFPRQYISVLEAVAHRHGVALGDVTPQPPQRMGDLGCVAIGFSLGGPYAAVARFVHELEQGLALPGPPTGQRKSPGGRIVRVALLDLSSSPGGGVQGALRVEAYTR